MFKAVRGIFIFLGKENSVLSTQPEIFEQLVSSLHELFKGKQCIRSECGFSWVALFFRGYEKPLFLCWRDPFSGLCLATEENVTGLVITENGTPPFSEALRKYMVRSSLVRINRIGGDRVIAMEYSRKIGPGISRKSSLVCEFAGKRSGIFIIDESGKIIESSRKHREQADPSPEGRPGCLYSPPTAFQGYSLASQDGPDLFYCLESITGIGKRLGSQLVKNWHLFPRKDWSYMISRVIKRDMPPINRPGLRLQIIGKDISIFPVLLGNNPSLGGDIADVLADTTILPLSRDRLRNFKNRLLKDAGAVSRRLSSMRSGLTDQIRRAKDAWVHKASGDLLLSGSRNIPRGSVSVTLPYWDGDHYRDLDIRIDPALSISQNAQAYYRKFRKQASLRTGLDGSLKAIEEHEFAVAEFTARINATADLSEIALLKEEAAGIAGPPEISKENGPVREYRFLGYRVIAGTNRKANRRVTFVIASPEDIWLHARGVPGGHVVVKRTGRNEIPDPIVLQFAASLAASLSRSSKETRADVDYTVRKHVRAIPGTVAEVTYSNARTIKVSPDLWKELLKGTGSIRDEWST